MKKWLNRIPRWLKTRYSITLVVFVLWMLIFDQNDIFSQIQLRYELFKLEEQKVYYQEQIKETDKNLKDLLNDDAKLEKFAREKYLMKKPQEEIFVIVPESE